MKPERQLELIHSYIASRKLVWDEDKVLRHEDDSSWASDTLHSLASSNPSLCLRLLCEITSRDSSDEVTEPPANGPLSILLKHPFVPM
jgi:hypothetical protein